MSMFERRRFVVVFCIAFVEGDFFLGPSAREIGWLGVVGRDGPDDLRGLGTEDTLPKLGGFLFLGNDRLQLFRVKVYNSSICLC